MFRVSMKTGLSAASPPSMQRPHLLQNVQLGQEVNVRLLTLHLDKNLCKHYWHHSSRPECCSPVCQLVFREIYSSILLDAIAGSYPFTPVRRQKRFKVIIQYGRDVRNSSRWKILFRQAE